MLWIVHYEYKSYPIFLQLPHSCYYFIQFIFERKKAFNYREKRNFREIILCGCITCQLKKLWPIGKIRTENSISRRQKEFWNRVRQREIHPGECDESES